MIIDLTDPFFGPIAAGLVLMIIAGTYHYIATLVLLKKMNQQFSNILSEINTLHKEYKNQISKIKKIDDKIIRELLERYDNQIAELIKHNSPPKLGRIN
jgi:hypothetical protein